MKTENNTQDTIRKGENEDSKKEHDLASKNSIRKETNINKTDTCHHEENPDNQERRREIKME